VRLFVALFPPIGVLSSLAARLDGRGRLTPTERWHITLRFLGEVADDDLADLERALDGIPRAGKISLHLAGGGAFGNGRSTAVWAGVRGEVRALTALHDAVADALGVEPGPFTPHLTVAYADNGDVRQALEGYTGPEWTADEFVLVRSRHGYDRLRSWPLAG
jgi:2'-5' RNA ligase